jgi:hypothetical protein
MSGWFRFWRENKMPRLPNLWFKSLNDEDETEASLINLFVPRILKRHILYKVAFSSCIPTTNLNLHCGSRDEKSVTTSFLEIIRFECSQSLRRSKFCYFVVDDVSWKEGSKKGIHSLIWDSRILFSLCWTQNAEYDCSSPQNKEGERRFSCRGIHWKGESSVNTSLVRGIWVIYCPYFFSFRSWGREWFIDHSLCVLSHPLPFSFFPSCFAVKTTTCGPRETWLLQPTFFFVPNFLLWQHKNLIERRWGWRKSPKHSPSIRLFVAFELLLSKFRNREGCQVELPPTRMTKKTLTHTVVALM